MQGLGAVPASVHRLGELVDLVAGTAEDQRRPRRLHVQDAAECGGLVGALDHVRALPHQRRLTALRHLVPDLDPDRIAQVPAGHPVDARRHRRGEENRLAALGGLLEDRLDVLGEPHVEHLVGLVQHHHFQAVQPERLPADVVQGPAGCGDRDVHAAFQRPQLPHDRLAAVDR